MLEYSIPFAALIFMIVAVKRYQNEGEHFFYSQKFAVQIVVGTLFTVVFVGMLKFVEDWFELEAKKKALENEKLNAELRFLKAQINPHFLFNSLNAGMSLAGALIPGGGVRIPIPNRFELRVDGKDLILFNQARTSTGASRTTHNLLLQAGLGLTF